MNSITLKRAQIQNQLVTSRIFCSFRKSFFEISATDFTYAKLDICIRLNSIRIALFLKFQEVFADMTPRRKMLLFCLHQDNSVGSD